MTPDERIASLWNAPVPYRRIRITTTKDIDSLYPLIAAFVTQPELAESVTEVAINKNAWPQSGSFFGRSQEQKPTMPVRDDVHETLEAHVRGMGLDDGTTDVMIRDLRWKKSDLKGEPSDQPKFNARNADFASTACPVILSLCKNISKLYLGDLVGKGPLTEYLLKSNYSLLPEPGLQKLETVEVITGGSFLEDERHYSRLEFLDWFRYFHRLPAIRAAKMEAVEEYQANRELFVPKCSNMKKIDIGHADISRSLLATIIRSPKALEEFSVSIGGRDSTDGGMPQFYLKTISKALLEHKDTLRVLDIDTAVAGDINPGLQPELHYEKEDFQEDDRDETKIGEYASGEAGYYKSDMDEYFHLDRKIGSGPLWTQNIPTDRKYGFMIGSLHDFTALTHLSIPVGSIVGPNKNTVTPELAEQPPVRLIDALPPQLEYLRLYGYEKGVNADVDAHVQELMAIKEERLPSLKEIDGIEAMIPDTYMLYEEGEENYWEQPPMDLDWQEA